MIELAKRSCVVLSDSDQPAKDQQKLFKKDRVFGDWRTYQEIDDTLTAVTGEDFIKKPFFIAQLLLIAQSKGLPNFPEGELPVSGRISTIEAWLREQGLDDQQAKDFLNEFKSMIFEKLAGKDVEEDYQKFLDGVAKLANSE
jgi:hypothetical protein